MSVKIEQHLVCGKFIEVEKTYLDGPKENDTSDRSTLAKGICLFGLECAQLWQEN